VTRFPLSFSVTATHGDDWADIIDMLTMHPEARRNVVRLLSELQAESG
jgi:hypothetical protein